MTGRDLCVECVHVFEIVVPDLVNDVAKEFGNATVNCLVIGKVIEAGLLGHLCMNSDDCRGIVSDGTIVEGKTGGMDEFVVAMVGFVLGGLCEDSHKGMGSHQLVIGNDHEEGKKNPPDGKQVVIRWFPFEREKGVVGLFEETGDGVGHHFWLIVANN
jgi:hypothetical protein